MPAASRSDRGTAPSASAPTTSRRAGLDTPELDARLIAQRLFDLDPMALVRREREAISPEWATELERAALRRLAGEPVSRIIGEREFWGLSFRLNEATLDPRPET